MIRFYTFAKWQCIFRHQRQKLCWDYLAIRTAKALLGLSCNSSSNVNIVEWLVSMTAVWVFVGSALTLSFGLANRDYNHNTLLRTHGPYHRHKITKSGCLYISAHDRKGVCTWPTLRGTKHFILTTAVSSFARAQKMDAHTVAHHTTVGSTCPTLRSKTLSQYFLLFLCLVCTQCPHIFTAQKKSNTGETQTPKQLTDNYCIWSPYRSVK